MMGEKSEGNTEDLPISSDSPCTSILLNRLELQKLKSPNGQFQQQGLLENKEFFNNEHDILRKLMLEQNRNSDELKATLSLIFPSLRIESIVISSPTDNESNSILILRVYSRIPQLNQEPLDSKQIFRLRITFKDVRLDINSEEISQSESHIFNEIAQHSSFFLSMKYSKPLCDYILHPVDKKWFFEICLSEYNEYSLREIISSHRPVSQQQSQPTNNYLLDKFSYAHLQKNLVEALFFMHTIGFVHNNINLDSVSYDRQINAFVVGGFGLVKKLNSKSANRTMFNFDIQCIGVLLSAFLVARHRISPDPDFLIKEIELSALRKDGLSLSGIARSINLKIPSPKSNLILMNLTIYTLSNILTDILCSEKVPDIVELAVSLQLHHCLAPGQHSLIHSFLKENYNELAQSTSSEEISPLKSLQSWWKYTGSLRNGAFHEKGTIIFSPKESQVELTVPQIELELNENKLNNKVEQKDSTELVVYSGEWESGYSKEYLRAITPEEFMKQFLLSNYVTVVHQHEHQELSFSVRSDRVAASKTIDLTSSVEKEDIVDSLNVLIKYLRIPLSRITFDLSGQMQRMLESQSIELQTEDGNTICFLFDSRYVIREEEFYIILEKATLSSSLTIQMTHTNITDKFFYGMSFNPKLQKLTSLSISNSKKISDEGFLYFIRNCPSPCLTSLDLSHTLLTDAAIIDLITSTRVTGITRLNLAYNQYISEKAVIDFIKSSNAMHLAYLNLSWLDVSDNFIEIICLSPFMRNLSEIILNDCHRITFRIFEIFTKSEFVNAITRIELSNSLKYSNISAAKKTGFFNGLIDKRKKDMEFKQFAKNNKLGKLTVLNLEGCQMSQTHIKQLASSESMKSLEQLNISYCPELTDECIRIISSSENFSRLRVLNLSGLKALTVLSLELIGNSKQLKNLDKLSLSGCLGIDKSGLQLILKSPNFQQLKILELGEHQFSIKLVQAISFSHTNNIQTFWRLQTIEIAVTTPDHFFKLNVHGILSFNLKPIRFIVPKQQELQCVVKISSILKQICFDLDDTNCRLMVNDLVMSNGLMLQIDSLKNSSLNPILASQAQNSIKDSQLIKNFSQTPQQTGIRSYCKNECFKAMQTLDVLSNLSTLNLSGSRTLNMASFQLLKECSFLTRLIELNLSETLINNVHLQEICSEKQFINLRVLNLKGCSNVNFSGFQILLDANIAPLLQYLDVTETSIEGTQFTFSLINFPQLSQLNRGIIQIIMHKKDIKDEEEAKQKVEKIFERLKTLFFIQNLSLDISKVQLTSQIFEGLSHVLSDHFNTITQLSIKLNKARNMSSEQNFSLWSGMSQLAKLKTLSLQFENCRTLNRPFLKNLFFALSILSTLEECRIAFPKTQLDIESDHCIGIAAPLLRLTRITSFYIDFSHQVSTSNPRFIEELHSTVTRLENIRILNLDYSQNGSSTINPQFLLETLENSKLKLYSLTIDLEQTSLSVQAWKSLKNIIHQQSSTLRNLSLNMSFCIELKEEDSLLKFLHKCVDLKMLKDFKFYGQGITKLSPKWKENLQQNPNIYLLETFDIYIQEDSA